MSMNYPSGRPPRESLVDLPDEFEREVQPDEYPSAGAAHFNCPTLHERLGNRHHTEIAWDELRAQDAQGNYLLHGDGHTTWSFHWDKFAWKLSHKANGGVPKCAKCGKTLIWVAGDDPT